jgi:hypothetical protein
MYRHRGDPEAPDPLRQGCSCRICDSDVGLERLLRIQSNRETGHKTGCECDDCEAAYRRSSVDDLRDEAGCDLQGFDEETRHWYGIYQQLAQERIDPRDYDVRYLQVAQIGDSVQAQITDDKTSD